MDTGRGKRKTRPYGSGIDSVSRIRRRRRKPRKAGIESLPPIKVIQLLAREIGVELTGGTIASELKFDKKRKWRSDLHNKELRLVVEYEGGVFTKVRGRHLRPIGYHNDCNKYNVLNLQGWTLLRFTARHLQEPDLIQQCIKEAYRKRVRG